MVKCFCTNNCFWARILSPSFNGHLEISASVFWYQHRYWYWHQHRHSNKKIVIYTVQIAELKHVVFNKLKTFWSTTRNFLRKCLAKISRRNFSKISEEAILQIPHRKTSMLESFFDEIVELPLDLQLYWKEDSTKDVFQIH